MYQGAFGKVKLVKKKDSGEYYALKIQRKDLIVQHKQENVVVKEYEMMKKLSHPNIVTMVSIYMSISFVIFICAPCDLNVVYDRQLSIVQCRIQSICTF
jgi:serine/threonine protein kinase